MVPSRAAKNAEPTWSEYVAACQRMAARAERPEVPGLLHLPPSDAELVADASDRAIVTAYWRARIGVAAV